MKVEQCCDIECAENINNNNHDDHMIIMVVIVYVFTMFINLHLLLCYLHEQH